MEVRLITEKKFLSHTRSIEAFSDVRFVHSKKGGVDSRVFSSRSNRQLFGVIVSITEVLKCSVVSNWK